MRTTIVLLAALALGACTQADGSKAAGAVGSPIWMLTASASAKQATYEQACLDYGFQPGAPYMAQCMQSEANAARDSAARAMESMSDSIDNMSYRSQMTTTNCNAWGNSLHCTTF